MNIKNSIFFSMKIVLLSMACQIFAQKAHASTDSAIKVHTLDEVEFRFKTIQTHSKNFNVNRKSLRNKYRYGLPYNINGDFTYIRLSQELNIKRSSKGETAKITAIKCKIDRYDTGVYSMYLVVRTTVEDSNTRFFSLNRAVWNEGWAELYFYENSSPVIDAGRPFYLGFTAKITNPKFQYVNYELYQSPVVSRQFLPLQRYDKSVEKLAAKSAIVRESPENEFPFKIQYVYYNKAN